MDEVNQNNQLMVHVKDGNKVISVVVINDLQRMKLRSGYFNQLTSDESKFKSLHKCEPGVFMTNLSVPGVPTKITVDVLNQINNCTDNAFGRKTWNANSSMWSYLYNEKHQFYTKFNMARKTRIPVFDVDMVKTPDLYHQVLNFLDVSDMIMDYFKFFMAQHVYAGNVRALMNLKYDVLDNAIVNYTDMLENGCIQLIYDAKESQKYVEGEFLNEQAIFQCSQCRKWQQDYYSESYPKDNPYSCKCTEDK